MDFLDAVSSLLGKRRAESTGIQQPTNVHLVTMEAVEASSDGTVLVDPGGDVISPDGSQYVEIQTVGSVQEGDEVAVALVGEPGGAMDVMSIGTIGEGDRQNVRIGAIEADYVKATELEADVADIGFLKADSATITDLQADAAKVHSLTAEQLSAATGYVGELQAGSVSAQDIVSGKATVGQLAADHVSVSDLDAATARIGDLEADHVSVDDFSAEQANIDNLQAATADIATIRANSAKVANLTAAELEADHATIGSLDTNYAQVNLANVDNAWIENGTVKDGAITNAMINSVSANKLTAGTIDASNINVTNLNADNLTTGTINGQRIGEGSLSLSKLEDDVYTESEVDGKLATMQAEIDGAIETWTGTEVPTLNNTPASGWTTADERDRHVGDVYFVVNSQSQQNGYNYRFTKSNGTYSWQLIKDNDVTNALQRLTDAEGHITQFTSDISQLQTDTGTLTTKTESLETSLGDKVDVTTFNSLEDTVDGHTQTLSQHTTAISNKADNSTVTAVTNRVSKNEQDISGLTTSVGQLQTTVATKADGSTVETIANNLSTLEQDVDGFKTTVSETYATKVETKLSDTKTGEVIEAADALSAPPIEITFYGKTSQPSPGRTNLIDYETCSMGKYMKSDGTEGLNSIWFVTDYIPVSPVTNYTIFGNKVETASPSARHIFYDSEKAILSNIYAGNTNNSFTTPENAAYVRLSIRSETTEDVTFELGPNVDSPMPIYNVDDLTLHFSGKNLLRIPTYEECMAAPVYGSYHGIAIQLEPNTTYYFHAEARVGYSSRDTSCYILLANDHGNSNWKSVAHHNSGATSGTLTTGDDGILWYNTYSITKAKYEKAISNTEVQLEVGTEFTGYEPCRVADIPIPLQGHKLAAYGAFQDTLTLTQIGVGESDETGLYRMTLNPDMGFVDLGTLTWAGRNVGATGEKWATNLSDMMSDQDIANRLSSAYIQSASIGINSALAYGHIAPRSLRNVDDLYVKDYLYSPATSSAADFKEHVAGVQFLYGLDAAYRNPIDLGTIELPLLPAKNMRVWATSTTIQPEISLTYWLESAEGITTPFSRIDSNSLSDLTALTTRVSTAESTIEQHSGSIALKANSADVYTKTQSDGLISTEVTNRNAAITAATDAINLSVSQNYATKTELSDGLEDANDYTDSEVTAAKAAIKVTTDGISTEVSKKADSATIISTINQSAETVKIQASKVEITGEAVFNAINNDTGTTTINGGKVDADTVHVKAANIDGTLTASQINASGLTIGQSQVTGLTTALDGKADTSDIPTNVSDLTNDSGFITDAAIPANNNLFGTCSTAAGTTNKTVVCPNVGSTVPVGTTLTFTSSAASSAAAPKIVIKNSDNETVLAALPVWVNNAVASASNPILWTADATLTLVLHDTYWEVVDKPGSFAATSSTAAGTVSKTATLSGATILDGTVVSVTFSTANTATALTLNVGSTGYASIRLNNAAVVSSNPLNWKANTTITFVRRDSYWHVADNGAISLAEDAAKTATNYLTTVDSTGLMVHRSSDSTTGVKVTDSVDIMRSGVSTANFGGTNGDSARIGTETGNHVLIDSGGQYFRDGLNNLLAVLTNGINIYDGEGNAATNLIAEITGDIIRLGKHIADEVGINSASIQFFDGDWFFNNVNSMVTVGDEDDPHKQIHLDLTTGIEDATFPGTKSFIGSGVGINADSYDDGSSHAETTSAGISADTSGRYAHTSMGVRTNESYVGTEKVSSYRQAYVNADQLEITYGVGQYAQIRTVSMEGASVALRNPVATYTGTSGTTTATAGGWRLTYFNTVMSSVGDPHTYDYTFTNGTITALRDCVLEISGVMHWSDGVSGQRGFGIFASGTAGSGTEHSVFETWTGTTALHKSVTFPPKVFSLSSGGQLTFGRYDNVGAIYTNGTNFSWVTIKVIG